MKKKKLISLVLAGTMFFGLAAWYSIVETRNLKEIHTVIR